MCVNHKKKREKRNRKNNIFLKDNNKRRNEFHVDRKQSAFELGLSDWTPLLPLNLKSDLLLKLRA